MTKFTPPRSSPRRGSSSPGIDWIFIFSATVVTLPLLLISATLIGIIQAKRVPPNLTLSSLDAGYPEQDDGAYFVDYSATSLAILASWLSSVAPYVMPACASLIAFPLAHGIQKRTKQGQSEALPSPTQLGILVQLLGDL
jgi:hypothetical protein